jgi:hypothetical protein
VAERSNGQSRKAVPDRGPRGRIPLLPPTGHGSNPFSRNRLAGQKNGARLGENRAPACQKRLGEIRRRRGKGAGFRENCRSRRF